MAPVGSSEFEAHFQVFLCMDRSSFAKGSFGKRVQSSTPDPGLTWLATTSLWPIVRECWPKVR